jgi:hypothetical protein
LSAVKPDFQQKNVQFNIGGPLLENRLSLSVFVQRNDQSSTDNIKAFTLDGVLSDYVIRPSLRETYGIRGQYQTGENHTLTFSIQSGSNARENIGVGGFTLPERGSTSASSQKNVQLRQTGIISTNWIYETRLEVSRDNTVTTANTDGVAINVLDSFYAGGAQSEGEERGSGLIAAQSFMYNRGNITLKTGLEWNYTKLRSLAEDNNEGTYVFSSLDAWRAGTPTTFTITQGDPLIETDASRIAAFAQADFRLSDRFVVSPGVRYQAQSHLQDYNNLAPRLSFAYQVDNSTIVRGGAGIFHQELNTNVLASALRLDGTRQVQLVIRNPAFPDALAQSSGATVISPAIRVMAEDLAAPYTFNSSISVERAFSSGTFVTAAYDWIRGVHLYRSRDIDPSLNSVFQLESSGLSTFQGMTFGLRQRAGSAVSLYANYTYAFSYNHTDGAFSLPADSLNLASEWGRAAGDRRHQFSSSVTFRLPWDVSLNTMMRAQSGRPYNITTGFDDNGDTITNDRPLGADRNSGNGPSFFDLGFNLSKSFRLSGNSAGIGGSSAEGMNRPPMGAPGGGRGGPGAMGPGMGPNNAGGATMTFFVNVQNLLNKTNYANYSGVMTSPLFGQPVSALNSREVELGMRFNF